MSTLKCTFKFFTKIFCARIPCANEIQIDMDIHYIYIKLILKDLRCRLLQNPTIKRANTILFNDIILTTR